ncbi:hypothetical protein ACUN24_16135 [Pedobacter sp. WC2501]|uniref:hypothetical protein n=1 Tax=Pedobacter sp. WC2501 TaxID=3461400 RepID=UPI0040458B38
MGNNLSGKIPQTNLPKETELPENTDYRKIAGKGSLSNDPNSPDTARHPENKIIMKKRIIIH